MEDLQEISNQQYQQVLLLNEMANQLDEPYEPTDPKEENVEYIEYLKKVVRHVFEFQFSSLKPIWTPIHQHLHDDIQANFTKLLACRGLNQQKAPFDMMVVEWFHFSNLFLSCKDGYIAFPKPTGPGIANKKFNLAELNKEPSKYVICAFSKMVKIIRSFFTNTFFIKGQTLETFEQVVQTKLTRKKFFSQITETSSLVKMTGYMNILKQLAESSFDHVAIVVVEKKNPDGKKKFQLFSEQPFLTTKTDKNEDGGERKKSSSKSSTSKSSLTRDKLKQLFFR